MLNDLTALDSYGYEALKKALNQRVVVESVKLVPSRRNRVWVVETDVRPVVVKRSLSGKIENEFETLVLARKAGLPVPYPLLKEEDYLVLEYIPGESCEILINHMFSSEAVDGIGRWLAEFHRCLGDDSKSRIVGDAIPSNFILNDGLTYGLDLEDSGPGDPLDDLGEMVAMILASEPFFTPIKFDLCLRMIKSYGAFAGSDVAEEVRPYVSKHLRSDASVKPLFRRTLVSAAKALEKGWPELV